MELVKLLFEKFPVVLWAEDENRKIKIANTKFFELLEANNACIGKTLEEVIKEGQFKVNKIVENEKEEFLRIVKRDEIFNGQVIKVYEKEKFIGAIGLLNLDKNSYYKNVIDAIPYIISYKDIDSNLIGCNKMFESFLDIKETDALGKEYLKTETYKKLLKDNFAKERELAKNEDRLSFYEVMYGDNRCIEITKAKILDSKDNVVGIVGISQDITKRKELQSKMIEATYRDKLTNLYNRNYIERLKKEIEKEKEDITLIMADADGLKVINDKLGHLEGDKYLKRIGVILSESVKDEGDIIRWGGDEFIIILRENNLEKAKEIKSKIQNLCKEYSIGTIPLSLSLGIASREDFSKSFDMLIEEAESILYEEKNTRSAKVKKRFLKFLKSKNLEM